MMFVAKIVITLVITCAAGDQTCTSSTCGAESLDDATALLQAKVNLEPGSSRAQAKAEAASEKTTEGAAPASENTREKQAEQVLTETAAAVSQEKAAGLKHWLGTTGGELVSKGLAEFVAMTLFVFLGCGSAMAVCKQPGWLFQVSLTFGFAISALAYSIGHISGGQINCAVTFGLVIVGNVTVVQGVVNLVFQLAGAVCGSLLTMAIFSEEMDLTGGLGTNAVSEGFTSLQALLAEILGTLVLVFVVIETAVDPATAANRPLACLAIGISVFLAHSVMIPIDGCSINPTRTFGPALVKKLFRSGKEGESNKYLTDMWIFWVGPLIGAALAAGIHKAL